MPMHKVFCILSNSFYSSTEQTAANGRRPTRYCPLCGSGGSWRNVLSMITTYLGPGNGRSTDGLQL